MTFKERRFFCPQCQETMKLLRWDTDPLPDCPTCATPTERDGYAPNAAPGVIGDEIDVTVEHGLCHADGTPRRFTSRSEMNRVARETGWQNRVEHIPMPGSDRSPHTTRWV